MINVAICGVKGRMGTLVHWLVEEEEDLHLCSGIDKGDDLRLSLGPCDVIIDFSAPEASCEHARIAAEFQKPLVIGTTGMTSEQDQLIENSATFTPILKSPNMSIGVNLMWELSKIASHCTHWNAAISETHHANKADRPSGTALKLAEVISAGRKKVFFEEIFPTTKQPPNELWILSIRKGEVVGDHELILKGEDEELRITHQALDRRVFARGAIRAARWIIGKPNGLYSMADVLDI